VVAVSLRLRRGEHFTAKDAASRRPGKVRFKVLSFPGVDPREAGKVKGNFASRARRWRVPLVVLLGILLLVTVPLVGGGWYYSDALKNQALVPDRKPQKLDLQVAAVGQDTVTLHVTADTSKDGDWTKRGIFGLEWNDGYGQVGAIQELDDEHVVRDYTPVRGTPKVGDGVRLDSFAFPGDPSQALGMTFEEVRFTSRLGDFPAWFIDGSRDTWVIFVHGKGADRREALRMLRTVTDLGFPSLIITYRNDVGAPHSDDGFYRYGETEWQDLQAAAEYAVQHGAQDLILVGYSMGGAIVTSFLYRSSLSQRVAAVILDAPMLDLDATVDWRARNRFAPGLLKAAGKKIASLRFGVHWGELDYLKRARELAMPVLLFHGDEDDKVPVATSEALAKARPDIVTYVRTAGAGHVRSWNADPNTYEKAVRDFLGRLGSRAGVD
jgi:hypothetical protein